MSTFQNSILSCYMLISHAKVKKYFSTIDIFVWKSLMNQDRTPLPPYPYVWDDMKNQL